MPSIVAADVRIKNRGRTSTAWSFSGDVLLKNEIGVEEDTGLVKIGDGVTAWDSLGYASQKPAVVFPMPPSIYDTAHEPGSFWLDSASGEIFILQGVVASDAVWARLATGDEVANLGYGDMLKADYATNPNSSNGYVDKAIVAERLAVARTIELTGDVTGSATKDFSTDVTMPVELANTGVTAGDYTKVSVDAKGRVTAGAVLAATDIPDITLSKVTDAGSAAALDVGTSAGEVVSVGANGKIASTLIPTIPEHVKVWSVDTAAEVVTLTDADLGDVAIVVGQNSDKGKRFRLLDADPTQTANWVELGAPAGTVLSVNGEQGPVVLLTTSEMPEGSNLYYTTARVGSEFTTLFAGAASTDLQDGSTILHSTDTIVLDCNP